MIKVWKVFGIERRLISVEKKLWTALKTLREYSTNALIEVKCDELPF